VPKAEAEPSAALRAAVTPATAATPDGLATLRRRLREPLDGFLVSRLLSPAECASLVAETEKLGYSSCGHAAAFRNADTLELRSPELAAELWRRLQHHCRATVTLSEEEAERGQAGEWRACGVNEQLLFARYPRGGHFAPHTDGSSVSSFNERSLFSVIVYLTHCEGGGTTLFCPPPDAQLAHSVDAEQRLRWPPELAHDRADVDPGGALVFW
jgi:hypothetical protein